MLSLTAPQWIIRAIVVVISLAIHEYAHGIVSSMQGDITPKEYGRLTLNPLNHIDPVGIFALFIFGFGWAKPIPIRPKYYKNRRMGIILMSLAGPLANAIILFLALLILLCISISDAKLIINYSNPNNYNLILKSNWNVFLFQQLVSVNASLAVFNMIPIPPLDGSKIFGEIFGGKVSELIYKIEQKGTLVLMLLIWLPPVNKAFSDAIYAVVRAVANLSSLIIFHHTLF